MCSQQADLQQWEEWLACSSCATIQNHSCSNNQNSKHYTVTERNRVQAGKKGSQRRVSATETERMRKSKKEYQNRKRERKREREREREKREEKEERKREGRES